MGLLLYAMLVIRQVLVLKCSSNTSFRGVQIPRRLMTLREGLVPIFKQLESSGTEMEDFFLSLNFLKSWSFGEKKPTKTVDFEAFSNYWEANPAIRWKYTQGVRHPCLKLSWFWYGSFWTMKVNLTNKKAGQTLRWLFLSMFLPCALRQTYVTEGFAKGLQVHRQGCLSVALFWWLGFQH